MIKYKTYPGSVWAIPIIPESPDCQTCDDLGFEVGSAGQLRQCPACWGKGKVDESDDLAATIELLRDALQMALDDIKQREADVDSIRQTLEAVNWNWCDDYYAEAAKDALYITTHDRLKDGDPYELFNIDQQRQLKRILE